MIFVTGDTHGMLDKLNMVNFPKGQTLTKEDYVIILGDFGVIWSNKTDTYEQFALDWLEEQPWTTLFIDGNHENHTRLDSYPVSEWNGGKVHFIKPSVIHLMRGQVFTLCDKTFFTMGGAPSHDIQDGIFDINDYVDEDDMRDAIKRLEMAKGGYQFAFYRIKDVSWWDREVPSDAEWGAAYENLTKYNWNVDYVLTHECPSSCTPFVGIFPPTGMSQKLDDIRAKLDYRRWLFGHYHRDHAINSRDICFYEEITRIE